MSSLLRSIEIIRVVGRYRLDELLPEQARHPVLTPLLRLNPWRLQGNTAKRGERLRRALEDLGPVFIKFGQMLSTRRDLLPEDIADELALLQDQVSPFDADIARNIIETALGGSVDTLFERFDREPLASASVAQVHSARTREGREVVVKVIRPDIEPVIRKDMALLARIARFVERWLKEGRRLRPVDVVRDYRQTILDELDLGREAANASQLRRNFSDGSLVYVPEVFWDYTRRNVMVMERIYGIPVTDLDTLRAKNVDLKVLGERGVEIFFTQVFRDSFFHADMHPGNIFVDASDPGDPRYIAIDCAIIGSLSEDDQYYLARNLLAIFRRDYHEVAQLHVECGWVPPSTRVQDFESAMRAVCEPVFERPIAEISFGQLLVYLFQTAARFDMEVQPSLVLLQKTLLNIEGLGRQLYPQLNLWDTAMPFLEKWVAERYSPQSMIKRLQQHAPGWLEQLPQLPEAVMEGLQGQRDTQRRAEQLIAAERELRRKEDARARRRYLAAMVCIIAAGAALPPVRSMLEQAPPVSWVLLAVAAGLAWPGQSV
ncbi:ubiquinone biosynthesis regulatory protein kinase UbiB [Congregibacter litoralis]|uniref:Probable protein kinase UbiB n=1 Tax=Congregibacter litoralis KT71 TaxID=314285 RepID=A4A8M9_9GAMM|nr:ubiquinone biosynthesis regulatory protein kinase UbiB [Congregibacter litoralis]EAQ97421.1 2-octaprenylphenol hydroxylase [Congregibacter litoralis KT71]